MVEICVGETFGQLVQAQDFWLPFFFPKGEIDGKVQSDKTRKGNIPEGVLSRYSWLQLLFSNVQTDGRQQCVLDL